MENELKEIGYQSRKYPKLTSLINRVNASSLMMEHEKQSKRKAVGVDGVSKEAYGEHLIGNVTELVARMKALRYIPQPVRRTYIPKANGKLRPLGIPAYEDKLVQGVMADVLSQLYEERFLDCSYGFRPGRSAHDVVKYINDTIMFKPVNYVLEADIKGFFDNLDHKWLMKFLEHDIGDKRFLRYIGRFLRAGVMEGTELMDSDRGSPQGGLISPVLANVYLHYVLDLWVEKKLKKQMLGEVYYVRYADDFILMFQVEKEAKKAMEMLIERLQAFGLQVAEDKTRILPIGRHKGTKEEFDFLGFTFFNAKTRQGKYRVGIRTSAKKLKAKMLAAKAWLWERMHKPLHETMRLLRLAMVGHYNYYGVNGNQHAMRRFFFYIRQILLSAIRRRGQRRKMTNAKFLELWEMYIPQPTIKRNIWGQKPAMM